MGSKYRFSEQIALVEGDVDHIQPFVEALNRKLAEGYTPLSVNVVPPHKLVAFVSKNKRVSNEVK